MRIAFIHPDLGIGGAERLVVDAATCLQAAGHQVTVFTAHRDPERCFEEARDGTLDVRVHGDFLPARVGQRLQAPCTIARMWYLAAALGRQDGAFDVVVCDLVAQTIPVLRCVTRTPVVFYCHFPDVFLTPPRQRRAYRVYRSPIDWLEATGLAWADRLLVNSRFTAQRLQDAFPGRRFDAEVLHPGIGVEQYGSVTDSDPTDARNARIVLSIARYAAAKNVTVLIDAFAALRRRVPPDTFDRCRLVVAGGYDERLQDCRDTRRALRDQVQRLGLVDRIEFRFSISDAERLQLLAACACVAYTPADEHFGLVPLEAMACGRPVIGVDAGGVRETVRHGETGLLCAPHPDAFADALAALLSDPAAARRMGQAGRARVSEHFSQRAFGARLEAVLQDAIARRARLHAGDVAGADRA